jgi:rhamnosyltransferase
VKVIEIAPHEFRHGPTRNLGAAQGSGEFIVFLTGDAFPVGREWLARLVEPFDADDSIAGCFGPHLPHHGCDPIDAWSLERHFANFGPTKRIFRLDAAGKEEYRTLSWMYDFFSDNNSALRKSVWAKHPLPDVDMAEDQHWIRSVMRLGYAKAYVPDARVYHSHSFTPWQWVRNWYDQYASYHDMGSQIEMPTLRSAARHFLVHARDDVRYLRHNRHGIRAQARAGVNDAARAMGGYLGTHYPRLPRWIRRRLTNQRRGAFTGR